MRALGASPPGQRGPQKPHARQICSATACAAAESASAGQAPARLPCLQVCALFQAWGRPSNEGYAQRVLREQTPVCPHHGCHESGMSESLPASLSPGVRRLARSAGSGGEAAWRNTDMPTLNVPVQVTCWCQWDACSRQDWVHTGPTCSRDKGCFSLGRVGCPGVQGRFQAQQVPDGCIQRLHHFSPPTLQLPSLLLTPTTIA